MITDRIKLMKWIVKKKEEHDGLKDNVKARYCLRGFKETKSQGLTGLTVKLSIGFPLNYCMR